MDYINYGVPDLKVALGFPRVKIKSVRVTDFPLFGKIVDMRWEGNDFGLGVIESLNGEIPLKRPIMETHDVEIRAYPEHGCWVLFTKPKKAPSRELWDCYQAIAQHLLATPSQSSS